MITPGGCKLQYYQPSHRPSETSCLEWTSGLQLDVSAAAGLNVPRPKHRETSRLPVGTGFRLISWFKGMRS